MGSLPLDASLRPLDPEAFAGDSRPVVDFLAEYYRDVDKFPVRAAGLEPGRLRKLLPEAAPEHGEPMEDVLEDVRRDILPGLTHWQSPSFFAFFPMNASAAGFAGEMLSAGLNVVPFVWAASPAAAELESVVVDWMGTLLGLPQRLLFSGGGGGVLQGSTCEAVVCTLAAERDRALHRLGHESIMKLVFYASDQTHVTFQKGARLVGIPPSNFRVIQTTPASGYGLTADAVRCRPRRRPRPGAAVPLRHGALTSALSTDPEYHKNVGTDGTGKPAAIDYKDWQISLSRRFRAIKLWVVLRRYGTVGLRAHIRRHVTAAKWFERTMAADERFEVVVARKFSLVCFRLRARFVGDDTVDELNRELLAAMNASGRAFMTHFVVDGKFVIRLAVGGAMTEMRHVVDVWDLLQASADHVLRRYQL
ncbi:unnamed protein product [Miscanthus lutarioriparius]|uniref:Tryptophan decarboxylase n=1 Tax=Miscanthus lutarioriparius TaxID=422564 RepID=A0A811M8U0_9POAL|nr:unnamed protein product [Miscanthus lutarioriparius]